MEHELILHRTFLLQDPLHVSLLNSGFQIFKNESKERKTKKACGVLFALLFWFRNIKEQYVLLNPAGLHTLLHDAILDYLFQ